MLEPTGVTPTEAREGREGPPLQRTLISGGQQAWRSGRDASTGDETPPGPYAVYIDGLSGYVNGVNQYAGSDDMRTYLYAGYNGIGYYTQTAGTNTVAGNMHVSTNSGSTGTYTLNGIRPR
ncbi:MAG: hypothetical protein LC114_12960 [Bryobacterales bacterium]|nr:hypothetical protein [Bryobacterales bacterium]